MSHSCDFGQPSNTYLNIQVYLPLTLNNNLEKPLQGTYAHMFKMDNIEYKCENKRDQYPI